MSPRIAGLVYLAVVLTGLFGLAYVPSALSLTADNRENVLLIQKGERLYRAGLVALMLNQIVFLILPLALWRVLHRHGEALAALMVAMAVCAVPVVLVAIGLRLQAVELAGLPGDQRMLAVTLLDAARRLVLIAMTFWGLWLLPLGWLVWQARLAPRVIAVLLILGCLGYLVQVVAGMLALDVSDAPWWTFVRLPAALGEIGFCLWLVATGGKFPRWWPEV